MSQNIASDYTKRQIINYQTRSPVRASDMQDLADHQNLVWARAVGEWGGAVFDPPFKPGTTTLSTTNNNGDRDLDELHIAGIATRTTSNVTDGNVKVGVEVYADSTTVEVTITNEATSTVLVNAQTFDVTSPAWHLETFDITKTDVEDASGNPQLLTVDLQAADVDGSNASSLFAVRAGEVQITSASDVPSVASASTRYKGLTPTQQDRVMVALREDTMVPSGGGYPARQSEIGTPSDTDTIEHWADASNHRTFFSAGADTPTYNSSGSGLDIDDGEELFVDDAVDNNELTFFEQLRTGDFTLAIKTDLQTEPADETDPSPIVGSAASASGTGFLLRYGKDSSGNMGFRCLAVTSGTVLWDSGFVQPSGTFPASGFDEWVVEAANGSITVDVNGTEEFATSYTPSSAGTDDSNAMGVGVAGGTGQDGSLDAVIQGLLLEPESGHGDDALDWINGNGYTG